MTRWIIKEVWLTCITFVTNIVWLAFITFHSCIFHFARAFTIVITIQTSWTIRITLAIFLAWWIVEKGFLTSVTVVTNNIREAFITFQASESLFARAITIDVSTFQSCWPFGITLTFWKEKFDLPIGIFNLDKPSWQDGKSKKLGWHVSHLSPATFGRLHSWHFIPVNPSLQVQTPLLFPHSNVVEPKGLQ